MTPSASGRSLQFTGTPQDPYIVETTANLAAPVNWQPVVTNPADASGNWNFTVTNDPVVPVSSTVPPVNNGPTWIQQLNT